VTVNPTTAAASIVVVAPVSRVGVVHKACVTDADVPLAGIVTVPDLKIVDQRPAAQSGIDPYAEPERPVDMGFVIHHWL